MTGSQSKDSDKGNNKVANKITFYKGIVFSTNGMLLLAC